MQLDQLFLLMLFLLHFSVLTVCHLAGNVTVMFASMDMRENGEQYQHQKECFSRQCERSRQ